MKQEEKKCCGNCCWFYAEDTYGYGVCPFQFGEVAYCGDACKCEGEFVSKDEMKRHRLVLLKYLREANLYKIGKIDEYIKDHFTTEELDAAVEFANKYIKIFSKL